MRIAAIRSWPLAVPPAAGSGRTAPVRTLVVEVMDTDGLSGFGEALSPAAPRDAAAQVASRFAPLLLGEAAADIARHWQRMGDAAGVPLVGAAAEARSAIDIALWDLLGRRRGVPLHRLLGGMARALVPAYGSYVAVVADDVAAAQAEAAVAAGFRHLKVKLQPPLDAAMARARHIRRVVGPAVALCADPNGSFDEDAAHRLAALLAELDFLWLEEPLDPTDHRALARLNHRALARPNQHHLLMISAGESEFTPEGAAALVEADAIGLLQPDCGRIGGITGFVRARNAALPRGLPFSPHNSGGAIKAAASLQLAAALPDLHSFECSLFRTPLNDSLVRTPVAHPAQLLGGCLPVPDAPGLGIEVDRAALRRLADA
ncbi:mandelate racemase/muconate lactonizing enzyme family protein [Roseomonas sp. NAR14]|uniref:Mandelate racemase/muconate lactonizing enzyme family protein n=1 Tax=Roseomonas acroporae TaxID=2937791 RepID=A0A9X1YE82_9PROT|nr:mandelate racemase/muconate lactonizing enzyme family protein [Roseomonas acroporae]MCK8787067.1 mandelate racemase/muconate lactonizing enzyme family protein [Roseomonas acroporae]